MKRGTLAVGPLMLLAACGGKALSSEADNRDAGVAVAVTGGSSGDQGGTALPPTPIGSGSSSGGESELGWGEPDAAPTTSLQGPDAGSGADVDAGPVVGGGSDAGPYDGGACGSAPVSFGNDIVPIFRSGCTLSSVCHGQMGNDAEEDLYLGDNAGGTSPAVVYQGLVGVRSKEDPSMNLVTSGNLSSSYLWHKVYGDQNSNPTVASGCANAPMQCVACTVSAPCGESQPYLGELLPEADLCAIQNWIGQGASNN